MRQALFVWCGLLLLLFAGARAAEAPADAAPRPESVTFKKSWIKTGRIAKTDNPGTPWVEGDELSLPIEYYVDKSDDWGKTRIKIWVVGPWIDNPDGKYTKHRHHELYPDADGWVDCRIGEPVKTVFKMKVPRPFTANPPEKGKFGDGGIVLLQFVGADGKNWPVAATRVGFGSFTRKDAYFDLDAPTPGNLFTYEQPVVMQARLGNLAAGGGAKTLRYRVTDVYGQEAAAGEIVYAYTTYFNEHFAKKLNDERIFNITEACKRITGQKIAPGATFSFNELCAPYRKSNGYKKAPNISKEGYGYGGGVCQVSTTLYNCVLGLPLRVDKWEVHRDSGVAYAPQCFDSAVGSYSDLAFTNLLPYTLIVEAYPQDGTLTVLLRAGEDAGQAEAEARADAAPLGGEMMMLCDADQKCVSLYASSALNGEPGATVKGNTAVRVLERENDAVKVLAGEDEGWVSAGMLYDPLTMKEKKTKAKLNLRETPAADAPSMGTAAKGDTVFLLAAGREWALITADGVTGYVQLKYLK